MTNPVILPLWLVLLLGLLVLWTLLKRFLVPGVRWYFRRKSNLLIREINTKLDLELPEFKLTGRRILMDRLIYDSKVMEAVKTYSETHGVPTELPLNKVRRYAHEIVPSFNAYVYFRFGSWLSRSIVRLLYRVRLGAEDEGSLAGIDPDSSVVFIMNHRSNLDYILLGYLAFSKSALSFAVGEWARFWPVQQLVRSMGAFFVRRGSDNPLYRTVLARYIQMSTSGGVVQAVFPEGRLSRSGRLEQPKLGLLDYMLRDYDVNRDRDILFIPVGVNYDRVLEDRSQLLRGNGSAGKKGAAAFGTAARFVLKNLWLMLRGGWHRFGYAVANFGPPLSVKEYLRSAKIDLQGRDKKERIPEVKKLAEVLMDRLGQVIPVVPVPLVARTFLDFPGKSLTSLEIKSHVLELISRLEDRGAVVYIPRRDSDYAIEVGLRMLTLRNLVVEKDGLFAAAPEERDLLQYYANSIEHFF